MLISSFRNWSFTLHLIWWEGHHRIILGKRGFWGVKAAHPQGLKKHVKNRLLKYVSIAQKHGVMFKNLMGLPIQWCNTCWNILLKHRGVSFYKKTVATGYTNDGTSPSSHSQATEEEKWAVLSKLWMDERKVLNLKWRKGTGSLSTVFKHSICIIYVSSWTHMIVRIHTSISPFLVNFSTPYSVHVLLLPFIIFS